MASGLTLVPQPFTTFSYDLNHICASHQFVHTLPPILSSINTPSYNKKKRKVIEDEVCINKKKRPEPEDLSRALILYTPSTSQIVTEDYTMMDVEHNL